MRPQPLALYVHVPFCATKCPYCDFNTYAAIETMMPRYVDALQNEITQWGAWLSRPTLTSVFFGGGTPSYLPTRDIKRIMRTIRDASDLPVLALLTLDENPDDCTRERLQAIREEGVNRLSIGVQSFDDNELRMLGRRHNADKASDAVGAARQAGFDNLSIDLMFGLPYQFVSSWEHTLEEALTLEPEHISAYGLILEGGTTMEADVRQGNLPAPDPDLAAEMYDTTMRRLAKAGYEQYEISNWSRPGRQSTHNLTYWHNQPYLGVGPGAHAYLLPSKGALSNLPLHGVRYATVKSPRNYIEAALSWQADSPPSAEAILQTGHIDVCEPISEHTAKAETMMMGLRLNEGVSDTMFRDRFGDSIADCFPQAVRDSIEDGLIEWNDDRLLLTGRGRPVGNEVFARFVGEHD